MKTVERKMKSQQHGEHTYQVQLPESVQEAIEKLGQEKTLAAIHRGLVVAATGIEWGKVAERQTTKVDIDGKAVSASKTLAGEVAKLRAALAALQAQAGAGPTGPTKAKA